MHSVISAFDSRDDADRALERLVDSGIPRHDVHIEHHALHGEGAAISKRTWEGMEREVAVDRHVLESIGRFFANFLGKDNPSGSADTYAQHVEQGRFVLVMDGRDEAEAARAHELLAGSGGRDHAVVQRPALPPLRDVVAQRQAGAGLATQERPDASAQTAGVDRERAMAQGDGIRPLGLPGDKELQRTPGLRYGDDEKPR